MITVVFIRTDRLCCINIRVIIIIIIIIEGRLENYGRFLLESSEERYIPVAQT